MVVTATPTIEHTGKSPAFLAAVQAFENLDPQFLMEPPSNSSVVRRHSLSMINMTPPKDSIAADILGTFPPRPDLLKTKSMLNELETLTERLSDFGSCLSSSSSDDQSGEENLDTGGFKTMNEKKRNKKKKRKLKLTPGKESFFKKANIVGSN